MSNSTEIEGGLDPGWAPGAVNTIFFKDGTKLGNQHPPFTEPTNDELCLPVKVLKGNIVMVCL
jgi:hypothetical protein